MPEAFQEITGYRRLDELNEKLFEFSTRVLKEECLDLPEKVYIKREVELTDEQAKVYNSNEEACVGTNGRWGPSYNRKCFNTDHALAADLLRLFSSNGRWKDTAVKEQPSE